MEEWQHQHPACRCLNLEWSVWAGVGMGQRLGVLESLQQQGITPLPLDQALDYLPELLAWEAAPVFLHRYSANRQSADAWLWPF